MPFVNSKFEQEEEEEEEEDTWFESGKMLKLQAVYRKSTKYV